jgi:hypothetical protein
MLITFLVGSLDQANPVRKIDHKWQVSNRVNESLNSIGTTSSSKKILRELPKLEGGRGAFEGGRKAPHGGF